MPKIETGPLPGLSKETPENVFKNITKEVNSRQVSLLISKFIKYIAPQELKVSENGALFGEPDIDLEENNKIKELKNPPIISFKKNNIDNKYYQFTLSFYHDINRFNKDNLPDQRYIFSSLSPSCIVVWRPQENRYNSHEVIFQEWLHEVDEDILGKSDKIEELYK